MLLRSPGPISPDTYSGHIRRRALCPNRLRNGMSQRSSSSCQSDILPTMVGPSKSRPPMSHRKTDLGIPCRSKSAKVVLIPQLPDDPADALTVLRYARELVEWEFEAGFGSHEKIASLTHGYAATRDAAMAASLLAGFSFKDEVSSLLAEPLGFRR